MKVRAILPLIAIAVAGSIVIPWRRPALKASDPARNGKQVSLRNPVPPPHEHAYTPSRISALAGLPPLIPEKSVDQLLIEIQQALASTNLKRREFAFTNLFPSLAVKNAAAAARLAEAIKDSDLREEALRRIARLWAAQHPAAASAWAAGLSDPAERSAALTDVCLEIAQTKPAEAVRIRERFILENAPSPVLENLTQLWAEKDLPAALGWILARPQGEQRDRLLAHAAFVQSQSAPAEAALLVVEKIPSGETQIEAAFSVLHQWALTDFAAAFAWVKQFPDGPLRERAVQELSGIVVYRNPLDAP